MTREDAIYEIRQLAVLSTNKNIERITEALNMAIEALQDEIWKDEPNCSEKPNNCEPKICDTCRYYNSNIPCSSTPSACKEADKFAEEFIDGLKKLKPKHEPQTERRCGNCKHLTYRFNKVWCDVKCENPHDIVCDKRTAQTDCAWGKSE